MNIAKPFESAAIDKSTELEVEGNIRELVRRENSPFRQADNDSGISADNLSALLRQVSGISMREIENLIDGLQTLRKKLQADGHRIERDIAEYAALSQSVVQLTKIISEGIKKLPDAPISG